jgi:uncharacterized protein involved in exopolysaccharide biosynthesis
VKEVYKEGLEPDTFDIKGSLLTITRAAKSHKPLVFVVTLFTLLLTALYVYIWPPIYTATAMVMVERDNDPVRDAFYIGWNVFRKDDSRTEIELFTSTPVLKEVVTKEHLKYADVYHPFMNQLSDFWQDSWPGQQYHRIKTAIFPPKKPELTAEEKDFIKTVVSLKAGVFIEAVPETNAAHVNVKGPSDRVAAVANRLIDVYLAQRRLRYESEAQKSLDILSAEVDASLAALNSEERKRLDFTKRNDLTIDFQKETLEISKLIDLQTEIATARTKIATAEASRRPELSHQSLNSTTFGRRSRCARLT